MRLIRKTLNTHIYLTNQSIKVYTDKVKPINQALK
mgnify:FL=1